MCSTVDSCVLDWELNYQYFREMILISCFFVPCLWGWSLRFIFNNTCREIILKWCASIRIFGNYKKEGLQKMLSLNSSSLQDKIFCVQSRNLKSSLLTTGVVAVTRTQGHWVRQKKCVWGVEMIVTIEINFQTPWNYFSTFTNSRILRHSLFI